MDSSSSAPATTPAKAQPVLVLQGGGALGSYQAGAYQALCHFDFEPEWVAGISIGAINSAIIAGNERNKRVDRLKEFWDMVSQPVSWNPVVPGDRARSLFNETSAAIIATFGVPGFFTPRFPPAQLWPPGSADAMSYYDTAPLKKTLERLVDFDRINDLKTRLSVGAVGVTSGNFKYFDNYEFKKLGKKIGPEHIMASGALPPGFPAVFVEDEYYWDGGIASNTPLDFVLDNERNRDLLIFQVDLFSARGDLPQTLLEATEREKDIRFSSRTRMNTDMNRQIHNARMAVRDLIGKLPDYLKNVLGRVSARGREGEHGHGGAPDLPQQKSTVPSSKDYDFSHIGVVEHWSAGARDVQIRPAQGLARAAAVRRDHGDLRSHTGRRSAACKKGVKNMGSLTGKTAVVTGSTSGIGLAIARGFAGAGANIVINGFGAPADIERERSGIETDFKVRAVYSPADMSKGAEIAEMIALGEKTFGSVDILVNNAGIQFVSPIEAIPDREMGRHHRHQPARRSTPSASAVPGMKKPGWGRIINTASAHSLVASPFKSAYVRPSTASPASPRRWRWKSPPTRSPATASARVMSGRRWSSIRSRRR